MGNVAFAEDLAGIDELDELYELNASEPEPEPDDMPHVEPDDMPHVEPDDMPHVEPDDMPHVDPDDMPH
jgi:hypothetical protein